MPSEVVHLYPNVEVDSSTAARGLCRREIGDGDAARDKGNLRLRVRTANGADEPAAAPNIETMFMMADEAYSYISFRLVKEVIRPGR